jgi:hypothetical protein
MLLCAADSDAGVLLDQALLGQSTAVDTMELTSQAAAGA